MPVKFNNEVLHLQIVREFLQWNSSCDALSRSVNSNTYSKFLLNDRVVSICKLERVTDSVRSRSQPGTVVLIDETVWHVAAMDGVVKISGFLDEFDQTIKSQTLADQCNIHEGVKLPLITPNQTELLEMAVRYWSQCITKFEDCKFLSVEHNVIEAPIWAMTDYQHTSKNVAGIEVAVAWLIYIARDIKMSHIQIGWDANECFHRENDKLTCAFAKTVPFGVFVNVNDTFSDIIVSVEKYYEHLTNYLLCLSDKIICHTISTTNYLFGKGSWPLAVSLIDAKSEYSHSISNADEQPLNAHGSLITLQINKQNGSFRWIYDTKQISHEEIDRISKRLLILLESAKNEENAKEPAAKLNLLPKAERDLLLYNWNEITTTSSTFHCLHQIFEAQMECNGNAVEFEGNILSYVELNLQANQLAHYLIAQGVKPDDCIALCVERSTTMIIAMLGILKAGCAYVPLDPVYTSQRLTNILLDANPVFLLADATGRQALGEHQVPLIDLTKPLNTDLPVNNPDATKLGLLPTNLAYVIYTSGSTGTPKGVMVEHQQIVRLFDATNDKFGFNNQDKWCLFHSISFDFSVWEIWGALSHGSQLSIVPNKIIHSTNEFHNWLYKTGITVLNQTPSAFKIFVRTENTSSLTNELRFIILAGEALDPLIAMEWYKRYETSETVLLNMYGPTEATVYTTIYKLEASEHIHSIGRPLSDLCVYLLDSYGEPVPLGMEGEIYVSGAAVSRGYLNRPELTAQRFLPDPFNIKPTARMYRTGDLARYLSDGNLMFLGRKDQQVKIRGFRIELGEIEARLMEHTSVHEAVVQSDGNGSNTRLVAYVVSDDAPSLAQSLRRYLSTLLPDYMVPAAYVCLKSLPLTPSGKLDRRALPAPDDEAFVHQQYEAPQGEVEEKLAHIWRELLSINCIGRHDNFFALGGNSLLAGELLAQLRQIGLDTTVREVFDAPTLAVLASNIASYEAVKIPPNLITKDSTEITSEMLPLINLSQAEIDLIVVQVPGGVNNIQDIYGLTPLQSGILYHHLMSKEGDVYLVGNRLRFLNRSSIESYTNAMQKVIERHDIFRTAIFWNGLSEPAQVVLRQVPSLLPEISLDESNKLLLEQLSQEFDPCHYRLDLTQAPLMRLLAVSEPEGNWIALQLMHHIIIDHTTLERMQSEIHAIMDGKIEMLTAPTPFRNFLAQTRQGISQAEHTRFFTEMLGDIEEPTLPFGLSDIERDGSKVDEAYLNLPQVYNDQLRSLSRNFHISLASICHLAWAQVLAKVSGRESVVFGTVLLGRLQTGGENNNAMGPTINTLPVRLDIDDKSVESAVRQTHTQLSSLLIHEHAPLVLAQRCSDIPVGLPLFSALLNYVHNLKTETINTSIPGVSILREEEKTNYSLTLSVEDDKHSLRLIAQVISPISAVGVCTYMQQSLESLAHALNHSPQQQVRTLKVMPTADRTLLLHSWNQATASHLPTCSLHQLFEVQVECDDQAIAVEFEGNILSYVELNLQANQLAHYLIAQGVKPDDCIALCVERSTTMIIAMLGILKAGCAYVPLDPVYTSQRLTNILLDANPVFLLADATGRLALGEHQVPLIDLTKPLNTDLPVNNPDATKLKLLPTNLAYVIYTSGSTGTPKGVMVEHQQIVRLFDATSKKFGFDNQDKWCLFHSISFDVSVWEIWGALSHGSQLSIVPYKTIHSTNEFHNWICSHSIDVLNQTPSAFKIFVRTENASSLTNELRFIILAGEALDPLIAMEWNKRHGNCETVLVNMYGITEVTVHATFQRFGASEHIHSIGRPLPDLCVYLLDSYGEPVPLGTEGEIYISGAGVTRGYLNRPELTAQRFLPDPFNNDPTARMFRSGDLARYLPDGDLVFLGRKDQQVKIRGFRIELGEIEARLVEHHSVNEAVVQCYGNGSNTRLVAYVVSDEGASLAQNLRTYLSTLLPDYMVPAAYVRLKSLPFTTSGKLDRRALPVPDDDAYAHQQYEAPQGEIEERLAQIWCELLSVDHISRHDNFFALGGHSLLVVNLLAQLRQIGLDTTVREVFNTTTLAVLASNLAGYDAVSIPPNLITKDSNEITPEMLPLIDLSRAEIDSIIAQVPGGVSNIQDIYGLTPLQSGMLYHHLMAKEGDPYLVLSRMHFINRTSLERYTDALQQVIERHDILRTAIFWKGLNEPAQVVLRKVPSILREIKLYKSEKSILDQLGQEFSPLHYKLDLTQAPLLRLLAAPVSEESWVALQLIHHSIFDHVTNEILQAEIHGIMIGKFEVLTEYAPFRNFVAQARFGISTAEHMRFFNEMIGDIEEPTLPFGLSDIGQDGSEIDTAYLNLSQTLNERLCAQARLYHVSLASICHLVWANVLSKASGRESVVFGTVLLGRLQAGEENINTMGPMINTLPMRLDIDGSSVETAVRRTHAQLSALLAHEHAPLVLAQRCSGVPIALPFITALMNYRRSQKTDAINTLLPGVKFLDNMGQTTYPLTLSVDDNVNSLCLEVQVVVQMSAVRICSYMQQSLESLAHALNHSQHQPVRRLKIMPQNELTLLLHKWNFRTTNDINVCCLHQLFEAQAESNKHAIAVECGGKILSYVELNSQANQLAHYLIALGVKPDDRITLCAERNIKLVVAILGILKAGCAYLPLDPAYPIKRLTNILHDADPVLLLADTTGHKALGDNQVSMIDLEKPLPSDLSINNPDKTKLGLTPAHLAYIIYTSGSTGMPKGVMVEHRNVTNCLLWIKQTFKSEYFKHTSFSTSVSFDMSLYECFASLSMGTTLHVIPNALALSKSSNITMLSTVPSAVTTILNTDSLPMSLQTIHLIGEPLKATLIKRILKHAELTEVCNLYGQTETSFFSTTHKFKLENEIIETMGRPIANTRIYLLDTQNDPVPLGAEGEIYVGGANVARGYLNRPELTAKHFLPDPFNNDPTARMFRTGDLARYLSDGNLVFLGRKDQQVKIRGFRIELGEIEARLMEHTSVHEAVVQSDGNGSNTRLVAYVVSEEGASLAQNLRTYLSTLLPDYMVPAAYVCLKSLPLTPSGKLDRRALPAPDDEAFVRQQYEAPQGEVEGKLAHIWRELLSIDRIGRHDNFFALGGHSLLIVRLLAQLRQIGLDTTVREVFDAPTLAVLASNIASYEAVKIPPNLITKDSTEITSEMLPLINLSQAEIDLIAVQVPGGVNNIQDIYGLTPLQSGMLYHHLKANAGDEYLLVNRLCFSNETTFERYVSATKHVIERHDILRTAIFWDGLSDPAQVVLREVLSSESILDQLNQEFNPYHHKLDLTQAPLMRLLAAPELEGSWNALQLVHHIIVDYATMAKLQVEMHAIMNGKIEMLTAPTPFRNFVAQVRLENSHAEHTRFFTEMLGDIEDPTLPFGLSDIERDGSKGDEAYLNLSQICNDQLRSLSRNFHISLASICHLAWAQVLAKVSGRESVVFGTVLLGRLQTGEEDNIVMGPTINTLPIRLNIDDKSVETAVHDTHTRLSALLAHEHTPLVLSQHCSRVPAGLPLFSALLNYRRNQRIQEVNMSLPGVSLLGCVVQAKYPVALDVDDNDNSLCLSVQVLLPISATRICAYMQQSLESLVEALTHTPQQPVQKLRVMPPDERTLLLHSWNQTTLTDSPVCCLHQLFEAQVECDGQSIAVEYNSQTLSYSELNIQANRIAHYMISQGVKPDDRIALCVERSTTMIVALLSILKAGCAYVPLDPVYPSQRLSNILLDADPKFVLVDTTGLKTLGDHKIPIIELDSPLPSNVPIDNPDTTKLELTPVHLAYVIYTSGSTGTPKGVMVEHQQIVRLFWATHDTFSFSKQDKWCSFASISFDVSIWEIWSVFFYGCQLMIPSYKVLRSMDDFYDWICTNGITVLNPTFSAFKALVRVKNFISRFDRLRYVLIGGEELDPVIIKGWCEKYEKSETTLFNMYGTTETAVQAVIQRLENTKNIQSIGRPLNDLCVYLLDSFGEPTLIGTEGELYIGGAGVARGYLNRSELTAERFLPDPFNKDLVSRMYRTGDLARYLPDGDLVFLGRKDQQVKIRGFRIELGEIEARLVEHPSVHEAAVQSYGNGSDARLVAYVVAYADASLAQNLRTYLSTLLPDYMVPAAYVCLTSLPITPSGKLDRRALPAPNDDAFVRQQYEPPQGEVEEKLAGIWRELLSIDRISRHDNFFELGGHSLLVMHCVNKAKFHNIHVDARGIFSFPILKDLAYQIINRSSKRFYCSDSAIPVRQFGNRTPLFLCPDGDGDIPYAFELAHDIDKSIPVYVLPWPSSENVHQPSSIEEMAKAMIPHIKKVQPNGPCAIGSYCSGGILALEIAKQLMNTGYSVPFLGLIDTFATVFSLSTTEMFLENLYLDFPVFKTLNDSEWWARVSKLTLNEAIAEIHKTKLDLKNIDIEWEALKSKQRCNYQNICAAYKIDSLPIKMHLFRAVDFCPINILNKNMDDLVNVFSREKLGWEDYHFSNNVHIIPIEGDHYTMIKDPKNRSSLGKKISKLACSSHVN